MKKKRKPTGIYLGKRVDPKTAQMLKDRNVSVIVDNFHGVNWWDLKSITRFPVITVYYNVSDFPGKYCARLFDGDKPTRVMIVKDTPEDIRAAIPQDHPLGFVRFERSEKDIPEIVEVWM